MIPFADLPADLRESMADDWGVPESEAAAYFNSCPAAGRWKLIEVHMQSTAPMRELKLWLAGADDRTVRDLGHALLERSRSGESDVI